MDEFNNDEVALLEWAHSVESVYRNLRRLNKCLPERRSEGARHSKSEWFDKITDEYLVKVLNARARSNNIMEKHGYVRK